MPMIEEQEGGARLVIVHQDEYPYSEVRSQNHGDRRVGVHLKNLLRTPEYVINIAIYDPGWCSSATGMRAATSSTWSRGSSTWGDTTRPRVQ